MGLQVEVKAKGKNSKNKARLVARGFLQISGINFDKVYAHVTRLETIGIVLSTLTYKGWKMYQLDVNSTFLDGPLEEELHVCK